MIPYEDLVAALASWRAQNGLPTGPADYLGEPPPPEPVSFEAYEQRPAGAGVVDLEESLDDAVLEESPVPAEEVDILSESPEVGEYAEAADAFPAGGESPDTGYGDEFDEALAMFDEAGEEATAIGAEPMEVAAGEASEAPLEEPYPDYQPEEPLSDAAYVSGDVERSESSGLSDDDFAIDLSQMPDGASQMWPAPEGESEEESAPFLEDDLLDDTKD